MAGIAGRRSAAFFRAASKIAAALSTFVGAAVLVGWALHVPLLTSVFPGFAPMMGNTAMAFLLAGAAVLTWSIYETTTLARWVGRACALLVSAIALLTLLEYVTGRSLGIDHLLLENAARAHGVFYPGRMSVAVAAGFLCLGLALVLHELPVVKGPRLEQLLALVAIVIGVLAVIGYAYGLSPLYVRRAHSGMALHTGLGFALLGLAILWASPKQGVMRLFTSERPGGVMARRLWLPLTAVVILLGALMEWTGLAPRDSAISTAVFVLAVICVISIAIGWNARALNHSEERILHRERLYAVLSACNHAIARMRKREELLPEVCRIVCEQGGFRLAWIGWAAQSAIEPLASHGDVEYLEQLRTGSDLTNGPPAEAVRTDSTVVINDTRTQLGSATALQSAYRSLAAFPIHLHGIAVGVLTVQTARAGAFGAEEVDLLTQVASEVSFALERIDEDEESRRAEVALRETTRMLQTLIDASPLPIIVIDDQARVQLWSPAAERMFGWTAEEALGKPLPIVPEEELGTLRATRTDKQFGVERRRRRKDGSRIDLNLWSTPLMDAAGKVIGTLGVIADVTEKKKLEMQVRQSQKLDALGTLAGGIAHDFNNILTVLFSHLTMARSVVPEMHPVQQNLEEMDKACTRAANLVRQILTFGRQQEQSRQLIKLAPVVLEALQLLRSTIPKGIEVRTQIAPDLPTVMADATQMHQIIFNLAINAVHAIGEQPGVIDLQLDVVTVDAAMAQSSVDLHEGRYVRLSFSDTGCGMSSATLERIFDPFFTTKPAGRGTGLGLSVVRGIVKNHDGAITVYSEPGKGTQFRLYFPAMQPDVPESHKKAVAALRGHGERILYVDDEQALVMLVKRMFDRLGYQCSGFTNAAEALQTFRSAPDTFDLVITDLSMPGADGMELAREIRKIRPDVPVIIATGYIRPEDRERAREAGVRAIITKPATVEEMGEMLRQFLVTSP